MPARKKHITEAVRRGKNGETEAEIPGGQREGTGGRKASGQHRYFVRENHPYGSEKLL